MLGAGQQAVATRRFTAAGRGHELARSSVARATGTAHRELDGAGRTERPARLRGAPLQGCAELRCERRHASARRQNRAEVAVAGKPGSSGMLLPRHLVRDRWPAGHPEHLLVTAADHPVINPHDQRAQWRITPAVRLVDHPVEDLPDPVLQQSRRPDAGTGLETVPQLAVRDDRVIVPGDLDEDVVRVIGPDVSGFLRADPVAVLPPVSPLLHHRGPPPPAALAAWQELMARAQPAALGLCFPYDRAFVLP
jgi:hypothetical protein